MQQVIVGDELRRAREACNLSQSDLAELAGVTQQAISKMEKANDHNVRLNTAQKVMYALRKRALEQKITIDRILIPEPAA